MAELSPRAQAALLRVLQEREVRPVGAAATPVDVRFVAATHRDLEDAVEWGDFRADLLARLDGLRVALPPLRERREDLGLLVRALLARHAPGRADLRLSSASASALFADPWRRNVRELERAIEAALPFARDGLLELPPRPAAAGAGAKAGAGAGAKTEAKAAGEGRPANARGARPRGERAGQLRGLLTEHGGNIAAVARALGKDRAQVSRWVKDAGLDPDDFRGP